MAEVLPNFIVIGAMKAGTTSLWQYLRRHPQVFMSALKEPGYFTLERRWDLGREWYAGLFAEAGDATMIGEASTSYTKHPRMAGQPERMAALIPHVRLIYLVRQPVERIRSHYIHNVARGEESDPLERAVFGNPDYLDFSKYGMQLQRYLEYFPPEQMLVIASEDLRKDRMNTMRTIYGFLGIEEWTDPVLENEYHGAEERRRPLAVESRIRALPGYSALASRLPRSAKKRARRLTTRPVDREAAAVDDALRLRLMEALEEDVNELASITAIDPAAWGFDRPTRAGMESR